MPHVAGVATGRHRYGRTEYGIPLGDRDCQARQPGTPIPQTGRPKSAPPLIRDGPSRELSHLRLRLLQPETHSHLAVHRRRGDEVLARLFPLARAPVEPAEAEVAVGAGVLGKVPFAPREVSLPFMGYAEDAGPGPSRSNRPERPGGFQTNFVPEYGGSVSCSVSWYIRSLSFLSGCPVTPTLHQVKIRVAASLIVGIAMIAYLRRIEKRSCSWPVFVIFEAALISSAPAPCRGRVWQPESRPLRPAGDARGTRRDVVGAVGDCAFHADLHHRLHPCVSRISLLRARPEDVFLLVDAFVTTSTP